MPAGRARRVRLVFIIAVALWLAGLLGMTLAFLCPRTANLIPFAP